MTKRPTLKQACAKFVHRYTMDHAPAWTRQPLDGKYYAPHFASDQEWYDNTKFPGDAGYIAFGGDCYTTNQTWPLGQWLDCAFRVRPIE